MHGEGGSQGMYILGTASSLICLDVKCAGREVGGEEA